MPSIDVDSGQVWIGDLHHIDPTARPFPHWTLIGPSPHGIVVPALPVTHNGLACLIAPGSYTVAVETCENGNSRRIRHATVVPDPHGPLTIASGILVFIDPSYIPHWGKFQEGGLYDACCAVTLKPPHYGPAAHGFIVESGWGDGTYPIDPITYRITFIS